MFGPFLESWEWVVAHSPYKSFQKRHLNFITIHYMYILSITIVGSIMLYPAGGLAYIDALFFASGCATQSGLNTVNINAMNTYQQVILYFLAMLCNPIFINSFVVFVRLYWFERRFRHIVREALNFRPNRSRSKTETRNGPDSSDVENGVRGRSIVVLHNRQSTKGRDEEDAQADAASSQSPKKSPGSIERAAIPPFQQPQTFHRNITFADEVQSPNDDDPPPMLPQRLTPEQHIAILENQRKDTGALRIPGPRDYDRGSEPVPLDSADGKDQEEIAHENPIKRNITIDEPEHLQFKKSDTGTIPKLSRRRSGFENMPATPNDPTPPQPGRLRARTGTFSSLRNWTSRENEVNTPYLSWQPTIGRNSAFIDLTEEQREELGGIEYRSLKTLAVVLVTYWLSFHLLGVITLVPWIVRSSTWGSVVESDGQSKVWWGIFTSASLFNDLGFTLTPDSMESFQRAILPLILGAFLIVIGNTGFPCMLRFVIWISWKTSTRDSPVWEELRFLLDHPRRCFTLLFPTAATWWLFWILVMLNGVDTIFFIILDLHDPVVTSISPPGYRFLNGLFQAASTRTAGFASVNLSNLHPGIQVSYMIMMYISVFPIAISVRRTNVYEEKSLGIYGGSSEGIEDEKEPSYVGAHLRRQLSFDLWYIFLGLFIIAIAEGTHLQDVNETAFTLFSVLFEIVSAYGTVGLSLGYPNVDTSFSAQFSVISKLVIIAMQIRGRHRGLPYELDRAILLPSDHLHQKEDVDAAHRAQRRNSSISNLPNASGGLGSTNPTIARPAAYNMTSANTATTTGRDQNKFPGPDLRSPHSLDPPGVRRGLGKFMAGMANGPHLKKNEEESES